MSIYGTYIGNAIGFCHYTKHPGALNKAIAYKHKCLAKKCKYLQKYDEQSWRYKQTYTNK